MKFSSVLIVLIATATFACPLCSPPAQTWSEIMEESDIVLFGRVLAEQLGNQHSPPSATIEIVEIAHGQQYLRDWANCRNNIVRIDIPIETPLDVSPFGNRFVLLQGQLEDAAYLLNETFATDETGQLVGDDSGPIRQVSASQKKSTSQDSLSKYIVRWMSAQRATRATWNYVKSLPKRSLPTAQRLKWYLKYLEHDDEFIAEDAWGEFAQSSYEDIRSIKDYYPVASLRTWLANGEDAPSRIVPYALMLGIHGDSQDYQLFQRLLGHPSDPFTVNRTAYMSGMLLVDPKRAIQDLRIQRIQHPDSEYADWEAVLDSVDFLVRYETERCNIEQMKLVVREVFEREQIQTEALTILTRWKDWSLISRLPQVWATADSELDSGLVPAIVNFCVVCRDSDDATPAQKQQSSQLLTEIREKSPRIVRNAERLYGSHK